MEQDKGLIAALYARVSTAKQEDQETIESQVAELRARITSDGNVLPDENVFIDDGWTGEVLQRPGLDAMRDAALEGKFEVLYVYDRGRLSRIFAHQEVLLEELRDRGIAFVTLHDMAASTPEEQVLQAMQGVFAQYERVKIAERFRRGKLYKAKNGILINGQAPYGYRYIPKSGNETSRIELNEQEAKVARMIFQWVGVDGLSLREVIKRLHQLGIKPRREKRDVWTNGPLVRLLQNEVYVDGKVYYNKTEAIVAKNPVKNVRYKKLKRTSRRVRPREEWLPYEVPRLIEDRWLFEKVQKILSDNKKYASRNRKYDYLLTGLVYCQCGRRRTGDTSNQSGHHYYRCTDRILSFPVTAKCDVRGVNAAVVDGLLWMKLKSFLADPTELRKRVEEWLRDKASHNVATQGERESLLKQIEELREEGMRYAKAYGAGTLSFEEYSELAGGVKRRVRSTQAQLKEVESKTIAPVMIDGDMTDKICSAAQETLKAINWEDKKRLVHDIIDRVTVYDGGEVEVRGHLPLFDQKVGHEPIGRDCGVAECGQKHAV